MAHFTKIHFCKIANLIKTSDVQSKYQLAQDLAKLFSEDNEKFSAKKWFNACGVTISQVQPETENDLAAKAAYLKLGVA